MGLCGAIAHTLFNEKLRSGTESFLVFLSTQSFLAFGNFEYSKFLNNFSAFFSKIEQQAKENTN